jgi:hypothetical protein
MVFVEREALHRKQLATSDSLVVSVDPLYRIIINLNTLCIKGVIICHILSDETSGHVTNRSFSSSKSTQQI